MISALFYSSSVLVQILRGSFTFSNIPRKWKVTASFILDTQRKKYKLSLFLLKMMEKMLDEKLS